MTVITVVLSLLAAGILFTRKPSVDWTRREVG